MRLCALLVEALESCPGIAPEDAERVAAHIIEHGAEQHGLAGTDVYWPATFRAMTPAELREALRAAWTGNNAGELCDRFGVSRSTLYRALK